MAKLIIPKNQLPDQDVETEEFQLRFRVISDNQNVFSYWSPIYSINPELFFVRGTREIGGLLTLTKYTGYVTAVWDSVAIYKIIDNALSSIVGELPSYDIWIRFADNGGTNPGDWIYKERVSSTSLNIATPSQYEYGGGSYATPKYMYVEVYRPGRPISRYKKFEIEITQNASSVDVTNNIINHSSTNSFQNGDTIVYNSSNPIGGLVDEAIYWVRPVTDSSFKIFSSQNDALDNVSPIDLTSTGSGTGTFSHYPFLMYKNLITTL